MEKVGCAYNVDHEAPCLSHLPQFLSLVFSLRLLESHQTEAACGQRNTRFKIPSYYISETRIASRPHGAV